MKVTLISSVDKVTQSVIIECDDYDTFIALSNRFAEMLNITKPKENENV